MTNTTLDYTKIETINTAYKSSTFKRYQEIYEDLKSHHKPDNSLIFKLSNRKLNTNHNINAHYNNDENSISIYIDLCFNPLFDNLIYALLGHEFGHYLYRYDEIKIQNEFLADKHCINLLYIMNKDLYSLYNLHQYILNILSQKNIEPSKLFKERVKRSKEIADQLLNR